MASHSGAQEAMHSPISPIEDIIADAREGRMYILVDAEDRENEGDLIIPAQFATPTNINFMARHGRGLICLAMTTERVRELGLQPMSRRNETQMQTAFTVSIEAREGVTTGISAGDRARTVAVAIDTGKSADAIVSPGHIFPLMARDGGVLVRAGHTEASVDISRQAGLNPSAVICEIMSSDGSMARLPELIEFAANHGLKIGTIRDLIAYRSAHDRCIDRIREVRFEPRPGFRLVVYRNRLDGMEHVAVVRGDISPQMPTLVRVHRIDFAGDLMAGWSARASFVTRALDEIEKEGTGALVLLRDVETDAMTRMLDGGGDRTDEEQTRLVGLGAQILHDLGVGRMIVMASQPHKLVGLEGHGLSIEGWRSLESTSA